MNLSGKTVIFLGSSVTYGSASGGVSFVDLLAEKYGVVAVKEAVSGTTLADIKDVSYISRMKKLDKGIKADAFVCQLSTNDATRNLPLGEISQSFCKDDFDTHTVAGAIEYIIAYAKEVYACPIAFYTQARYDSKAYESMTELLFKIRDKWNIKIIDLWNNEKINEISQEERKIYLSDPVHPTREGYEHWWLPEFVWALEDITE